MPPPPTRSREWFRQQVAALGRIVRRLPPHRQEALLEHLADETPDPPATKAPTDTPSSD